jgi:hypothetical protein
VVSDLVIGVVFIDSAKLEFVDWIVSGVVVVVVLVVVLLWYLLLGIATEFLLGNIISVFGEDILIVGASNVDSVTCSAISGSVVMYPNSLYSGVADVVVVPMVVVVFSNVVLFPISIVVEFVIDISGNNVVDDM